MVHLAVYKPLHEKIAVKQIDLDMFDRNQIDELRVCLCNTFIIVYLAEFADIRCIERDSGHVFM